MAMPPRIKLPDQAATGDIIEVKALINHVMETGNRRDAEGKPIPRNIVHTFIAKYAGEVVFSAEFGSGISANPFIAFYMRVPGPGEFEMTWIDDQNERMVETAPLNVA